MRFIFAAAFAVAFVLVSTSSTASSVAEPSGASQIVPLAHDFSGRGEGRHHLRPDRMSTGIINAGEEERKTRGPLVEELKHIFLLAYVPYKWVEHMLARLKEKIGLIFGASKNKVKST
ncbi:unnamed protein product [Hyaloperonospora brassicae]|uniref:RxLR effector candidate protein n=1 Tax=Hyaloperonospora brassicae TaxID=162125 RepID=A0AAV0UTQ4_HYABA|nr:unnamed protein product [Hyaloperonospora brassicae]